MTGKKYAEHLPHILLIAPIPQLSPFSQVPLVARHAGGAPPFHLQIHIARTTHNSSHARKRHALFGQAESQYLFSWDSRLHQLFFTGCRMLEIGNQHPIKLPSTNLVR